MDLKEIHDIILFLIDKADNGSVTHKEIDFALDRGQMTLFNDYYHNTRAYVAGRPKPPVGYGETQRVNDALSPFKEVQSFTSSSSGVLSLPANYMYLISLYTSQYNNALQRNEYRPVQVLNEEELISRLESQVVPVTGRNPICILNSQKRVQLYPEVSQTGKVFYFRRPAKPNFVYSQSGRVITYNQNASTQLEWNEQEITNIINRALSNLGLNMSNQEITQYASYKDQRGE